MLRKNIERILSNESTWDVTLVGRDGGTVSCSKVILAAGSRVFEKMFFGDFREKEGDKVALDFTGAILQSIVWYLHTDEMDLDKIYHDVGDGISEEEARLLVEFRHAADFLELKELKRALTFEICDTMCSDDTSITCAVLDEAFLRGEKVEGSLWDVGKGILFSRTREALLPPSTSSKSGRAGVTTLGAESFQVILIYLTSLKSTETVRSLVEALPIWQAAKLEDEDDVSSAKRHKTIELAHELANKIDLQWLRATDLAAMKPNDFFPLERLFEALTAKVQNSTVATATSSQAMYVVIEGGNSDANGMYMTVQGSLSHASLQGANMEFRVHWSPPLLTIDAYASGKEIAMLYTYEAGVRDSFVFPGTKPITLTAKEDPSGNAEINDPPRMYYFTGC